ncbi:hypothetical protein M9H77_34823 [Catharanthus roseus]|uniref:Uncharacterized protein n=1 Tax=Catharanthus roseus TaxID=4058 RepID=A0ACB9ZP52_CATRO|nr:hypothetical protein M9H77_34823 [Catharanthus roseus]
MDLAPEHLTKPNKGLYIGSDLCAYLLKQLSLHLHGLRVVNIFVRYWWSPQAICLPTRIALVEFFLRFGFGVRHSNFTCKSVPKNLYLNKAGVIFKFVVDIIL